MPEPEKEVGVLVIEDNPVIRRNIKILLENTSHYVVFTVGRLERALDFINAGGLTKFNIRAVTVDNNLGGYNDGSDGRQLVAAIKGRALDVITIGLSDGKVEDVTYDLGKGNFPRLVQVLNRHIYTKRLHRIETF